MEVGCREQGKVRAAEITNRQLLIIHASKNREFEILLGMISVET